MMRGKIRITKTLVITVFVSTLLIEFVLLFMHGCSDGEGLSFNLQEQTFSVEEGCVCGGGLHFSNENTDEEFTVVYNHTPHAFWFDSYNPSVLDINNLPACCSVVLHDDTLSLHRLPLRPNTAYDVHRSSGCRGEPMLTIVTDQQGKVVHYRKNDF